MNLVLGIDCSDVIFYTLSGRVMPQAIESIKKIVKAKHFQEIYIISKVNPLSKRIFLFRLHRLDFWNRTGISPNQIYFCRRHEDKAAICKKLNITHFVDDRLRVLHNLKSVRHRYALNPRRLTEQRRYPEAFRGVVVVKNWDELLARLI